MRLGGMIVGDLGRGEVTLEPVGGEDMRQPAAGLAGGYPQMQAGPGAQRVERIARAREKRREAFGAQKQNFCL